MRVPKELKVKAIQCYSDSQLVVNQILGEYQARGIKMVAYLAKVKGELSELSLALLNRYPASRTLTPTLWHDLLPPKRLKH